MLVWCLYMCPVLCIVVVMFTCTLVRSHPDSRRCWGETWTAVITLRYQVGCGNKKHTHKERPEWGSVYAQNEAMKDILARCHKKTAVQVCTLTVMHCRLVSTCIHNYDCLFDYLIFDYLSQSFSHIGNLIRNANWCLFSQVKNKPWHKWVCTWFRHCHEQFIFNWTLTDN